MFEVTVSPHIRGEDSVTKIMWRVVFGLVPAVIAAVYFFGLDAVRLIGVSVVVCVLTEFLIRKWRRLDSTVFDGSAVITGILLAFVVPPTLPTWMMGVGAFLAIFLGKEIFGGLGMNVFNPALASRAILLAAFPVHMTAWVSPDGLSCATPLGIVKEQLATTMPSYLDLFFGNVGGCLGETSVVAILIGGIFLLWKKVIAWEMPFFFVGAVFVLSFMVGRDPVYEILAGGVMLGAFFMITDMVTSPLTRKGCIVFSLGCALITVAIRNWGGYPEGVCYSILIMNAFTPLIDMYCVPRRLGAPQRQEAGSKR